MKTSKLLLRIFLIAAIVMPSFLLSAPVSYAQTGMEWSEPVNLSVSGSSTNPSIVVDSKGTIHVIWFDKLDGYKYTKSVDGISWSPPTTVNFPFSREGDTAPTFLVNGNEIHILWLDRQTQTLYYSRSLPANLGIPSTWTNSTELADWVVSYDTKIGHQGNLYVGYIIGRGTATTTPGVNIRRLDGAGWSQTKNVYSSQYFRSLAPEDSNIQLGVLGSDNTDSIFVVWDDRSQKKVFLAASPNNGNDWDAALQISGPEEYIGLTFPYNIKIGFWDDNPLLVWWAGIPGEYCSLYSQFYDPEEKLLDESSRLRKELSPCPQEGEFMLQGGDLPMLALNSQDELSFIAWDGSNWSAVQNQRELSVFENPVTLDGVLFGCKKTTFHLERIYVVGCDTGGGEDIWFRSRELGSRDAWFPPPSAWKTPVQITGVDQRISQIASVSDEKNNVHTFWIQSSFLNESVDETFTYSKWHDGVWSKPVPVLSGIKESPGQFSINANIPERILFSWIDSNTGGIVFSWVNSERAASSEEWDTPVYVPSNSPTNSSPKILADITGRVIIVYAVPINERRGIYFVFSNDAGRTWSEPHLIFDARLAGWDVVDKPEMSLGSDSRMHVLFSKITLQGDQSQSAGLFYSKSMDGGNTWSQAELVSERPVSWSRILGYGEKTVHRLWQEKDGTSLFTFHQISRDGGESWERPFPVGGVSGDVSSPSIELDQNGNIHLLHLVQQDGITILHQQWDGHQWNAEESFRIIKSEKPNANYQLASSLSSEGDIHIVSLVNYRDLTGREMSELFGTTRFLEVRPSSVVMLPAAVKSSGSSSAATETQETVIAPTMVSPLSSFYEPSASITRNRNLVGFLFLAGVLIITFVILRPKSANKRNENKGDN